MTLFSKWVSSDFTFLEKSDLLMLMKPCRHFSTDVLQSVLTLSIVCWQDNLRVSGKSKLQKLVNICSKITGQQQLSLPNIYDRQVFLKEKQISNDHNHFLSPEYELLPSEKRFRISVWRRRFSFRPAPSRLLHDLAKESDLLVCVFVYMCVCVWCDV